MMRRVVAWMFAVCCLVVAANAHAQVRAWLDRDRIEAGETTTLNIAADALDGAPEYAPLPVSYTHLTLPTKA